MSGLVNKNDARRIGNAIRKIESATFNNSGAKNRQIWAQEGIPAKITQTFVAGQYACEEVQILSTPGFNIFEQKNDPRIWDGQAGNLPLVFEVNKITFLEPGLIVYLQKATAEGESVNQWYFDSGGGPPKAFHHCDVESSLASIHLLNDVQVAAPDRELGPALYGELPVAQVDPATGVNKQGDVKWRPIFGVAIDVQGGTSGTLQDGYLAPQFGLGAAGTVFFGDFNNRHLRMKNMGAGTGLRQLNIYHDVLPDSEIDDANEMFPGHSSTSGAYVLNQVGVDGLAGGSTVTGAVLQGLVNLQSLDILGHVKRQNGVNNSSPYEPPTITPQNNFLLQVAYTGTYPTSGTLYDVAIAQETRITDGAGADVVGEDGVGVNRLQWDITTGAVNVPAALSGGIPQNPSFSGDSTNYDAAKFGSDTDIDHDLSRIFNCQFTLNGADTKENTNNSSASLTTDFITLEKPVFVTNPDNNTDFDVTFSLVEGAIPIPYTRFDGTGRYEIDAYLFFDTDGLAPDANGDLKPAVPITNGNKQGVILGGAVSSTIKFNIAIPASSVDELLCCIYYVNHIDGAAQPNSFGFIFDGSTGDSLTNQDCETIVGAGTYECDVIPAPSAIANDDFTPALQGTTAVADLTQSIQLEIIITKGAAPTTDFSDDGKMYTIELLDVDGVTKLGFSQVDGNGPDNPPTSFTLPILVGGAFGGTAQETDGDVFNIEAYSIDSGVTELPTGQLTVLITIEGCPTPFRIPIQVDGSGALFCWSDEFEQGGLTAHEAQPLSDDFAGTVINTDIWLVTGSALTSGNGTISQNNSVTMTYSGITGSTEQVKLINNITSIPGPFTLTVDLTDYTSGSDEGNQLQLAVLGILFADADDIAMSRLKGNGTDVWRSEIDPGDIIVDTATTDTSGRMRLRRDSNDDVFIEYEPASGGGFITQNAAYNNSSNVIEWELVTSVRDTNNFSATFDNLIITIDCPSADDELILVNPTRWILTGTDSQQNINVSALHQCIEAGTMGFAQAVNDAPISVLNSFELSANFDSALANLDEDGQQAFMQFSTAEPETYKASIRNDAGQQKVKFETITGGLVKEVDTSDSTGKLTWIIDDVICTDLWDGTETNSQVVDGNNFNCRWLINETGGSGTAVISGAELFLETPNGANTFTRIKNTGINSGVGDFTLTMDYDITEFPDGITSDFAYISITIAFDNNGTPSNCNVRNEIQDGIQNASDHFFKSDIIVDGGAPTTGFQNTTAFSGTLEINRVGSLITAIANGNTILTDNSFTDTELNSIQILNRNKDGVGTNIMKTTCGAITLVDGSGNPIGLEKLLGKYKDECQLALPIPGSMPDDPTLRIDTTGASAFDWEWTDFLYEIPDNTGYCTEL